MQLDFLWRLQEQIENLDLKSPSYIGVLDIDDSVSILATPGGISNLFYDGTKDQQYNIQFSAKSKNQETCLFDLSDIYDYLYSLQPITSNNGSFEFQGFTGITLPTFVVQDEQGWFIYQMSATANLTIYKGAI